MSFKNGGVSECLCKRSSASRRSLERYIWGPGRETEERTGRGTPGARAKMEALRLQNDNLQLELQRLRVENARLREEHPEVSESVQRESRAERELSERAREGERRAEESAEAAEQAERRAIEAEERVLDLQRQLEAQQQVVAEARRDNTDGGGVGPEARRASELESTLREHEERLMEADEEVRTLRERLCELQGSFANETEAMQQQAELSQYRALEEERRKWEGRERRLEEELRTAKTVGADPTTAARLDAAERELRSKTSQLESSEALRRELRRERDVLKQENLELQELQAELALYRARQRRLEAASRESCPNSAVSGEHEERRTREEEQTEQQELTRRMTLRFQPMSPPAVTPNTGVWATTQHASVPSILPGMTRSTLPCSSNPVTAGHSSLTTHTGQTRVTQMNDALDTSSPRYVAGRVTGAPTPRQATLPLEQLSGGIGGGSGAREEHGAFRPIRGITMPGNTSPMMAAALPMSLMTPLPRIPPFSGEGQEVGFVEWHEHFENVAKLAGWDDHWRLVHLTASLKDTAASFYRSCSCDVRNDYQALLTELKRRFTPVHLTAVQTQLFHARVQGEKESVEQFVQDLRKLFNCAYAKATREGPQAERMGQTLLANQFVAGLRPDLKRKLIGVDGSLEELVLKARFEEAKGREFATPAAGNLQSSREPLHKQKGASRKAETTTTTPEEQPVVWRDTGPENAHTKGKQQERKPKGGRQG